MKATKPTNTKTKWQVRWVGVRWHQTFKTRQEAREAARNSWVSEWHKPLIVKVTEQVIR